MHVIATNLTIWIGLVIHEAAAAVIHNGDSHEEHSTSSPHMLQNNDSSSVNDRASSHGSHHTGIRLYIPW